MKAIYINSIPAGGEPDVTLYADSSVCRDGAPLFMPDCYGPWTGAVCLAARVGRLGKSIEPKFAYRYIDGVTLVHVLHSPGSDLQRIVDQAVICGRWFDADLEANLEVRLTDGAAVAQTSHSLASLMLPQALAAISTLATVKTGDLLIFASSAMPTSLTPDTYISATLNNQPCIRFKIK